MVRFGSVIRYGDPQWNRQAIGIWPSARFHAAEALACSVYIHVSMEANRTFVVVRINRDNSDTHAASTLDRALDLANADAGDVVEWGTVVATDVGMARLTTPAKWSKCVG